MTVKTVCKNCFRVPALFSLYVCECTHTCELIIALFSLEDSDFVAKGSGSEDDLE